MPIIIKKIQSMLIPLAARFVYDANNIIIIGGTRKKKILDTLKTQYIHSNQCKIISSTTDTLKISFRIIASRITTIEWSCIHQLINSDPKMQKEKKLLIMLPLIQIFRMLACNINIVSNEISGVILIEFIPCLEDRAKKEI